MGTNQKDEEDNLKFSALLAEYNMLSEEVRMYMKEIMKIPVLTAIILAYIFGSGGTETFSKFSNLLVVPVLAGLFFYLSFLYYCVIKLGRHRALVEEEINQLAGEVVMCWNSKTTKELEWASASQGRKIKIFGVIFNPIYLLSIFGISIAVVVVFLLFSGRLSPSEILGPYSAQIFAILLILSLLSFVYITTLGRRKVEKTINLLRKKVEKMDEHQN